ncbi:unnamed protein product [Heterosigma akashiwo]
MALPLLRGKLLYVYDPMCSWCWGYRPVWLAVSSSLKDRIQIGYVLGGLAPDNDEPMPENMKSFLQQTWRRIEQQLGTEFNHDFWSTCAPRRDTYKACRASLAARYQGKEEAMVHGIQQAYYLRAMNPSDYGVLEQVAQNCELDLEKFTRDIYSQELNEKLMEEIEFAQTLPIQGFPSLVLQKESSLVPIPVDYSNPENTVRAILDLMSV